MKLRFIFSLCLALTACSTVPKNLQGPAPRSVASESAADSIFTLQIENAKVRLPKYLFSWGSSDRLNRLAKIAKGNQLPLPKTAIGPSNQGPDAQSNEPIITAEFPALKGKAMLFAWNHPTGAMALLVTDDEDMPGEIYAKSIDGRPPTLITMKPKAGARIAMIESSDSGPKKVKFDNVDIVFHTKKTEYGAQFREWIVLNPNAIESFTADPKMLPPEVVDELQNSTRSGAKLAEGQSFLLPGYQPDQYSKPAIDKAQSNEFRGDLVQKYLEGTETIPAVFRQPLK